MENPAITESPQQHFPVLGGKAYVFKRFDSQFWQAAAYLNGHNYRHSTKEAQLRDAIQSAENWYMELRGQDSVGALQPPSASQELTFADWAEIFLKEYSTLTAGERSEKWTEGHASRLRVHINPFMGHLPISQIDSSIGQQYRLHRMTIPAVKNPNAKDNRPFKAKPPARKTLHNELITIRLVLKAALRHHAIGGMPDLSAPYRGKSKVSHRPWFSPGEYKQLYTATREYKKTALAHIRWSAEQVHDFVLFMGNTGLRPDEAMNLQHRDIEIIDDGETDEAILLITVRGKRGIGYCKSMPGAVRPYQRLLNRPKPSALNDEGEETNSGSNQKQELPRPEDFVFPANHIKLFNNLLKRHKLKFDRDGHARTAYSLRHTYICMRLMEGADIYQLAKNCRTSAEMIEKHYAAHIKHLLDPALINIRKPKKSKNSQSTEEDDD